MIGLPQASLLLGSTNPLSESANCLCSKASVRPMCLYPPACAIRRPSSWADLLWSTIGTALSKAMRTVALPDSGLQFCSKLLSYANALLIKRVAQNDVLKRRLKDLWYAGIPHLCISNLKSVKIATRLLRRKYDREMFKPIV